MAAYTHIDVTPSGGPLGAQIRCAPLAALDDEAAWEEIHRAWLKHLVVWFPDQPLSADELADVTLRFGPGFGTEPFVKTMPDHPHVMAVRRAKDEAVSPFGAAWHSDWSFQGEPPAATLLHARIVPPAGGDTCFANQYLAYETLPEATKAKLEGLKGVHSARQAYGPKSLYAKDKDRRSMDIVISQEAEDTVRHPVVREHPETGRKALFVNPVYTVAIEGLDSDAAARALLADLCAHSVEERFQWRHSWAPDMLAVWDNRCTQHLATGGYDGHERLMYRTTSAGTRP